MVLGRTNGDRRKVSRSHSLAWGHPRLRDSGCRMVCLRKAACNPGPYTDQSAKSPLPQDTAYDAVVLQPDRQPAVPLRRSSGRRRRRGWPAPPTDGLSKYRPGHVARECGLAVCLACAAEGEAGRGSGLIVARGARDRFVKGCGRMNGRTAVIQQWSTSNSSSN